ncbi:hypothetical protein PENSUB_7974 [Penicillium subrubescens]|uniref:Uncharacterized protein n=1 Tax=Penicillium subrubescens TaxID=1316194 RepID=A0A1Q5TJW7_9EURO|nr:hypothetical protein PENSUB_7974 [Penicillium subrubescens]
MTDADLVCDLKPIESQIGQWSQEQDEPQISSAISSMMDTLLEVLRRLEAEGACVCTHQSQQASGPQEEASFGGLSAMSVTEIPGMWNPSSISL